MFNEQHLAPLIDFGPRRDTGDVPYLQPSPRDDLRIAMERHGKHVTILALSSLPQRPQQCDFRVFC